MNGGRSVIELVLFLAAFLSACGTSSGPPTDADGDVDVDVDGDSDGDVVDDGSTEEPTRPEGGVAERAVTGVQPNHGPWTGGTEAILRGRGFGEGIAVFIGGRQVDAVDLSIIDDNRVAIVSPAGDPGAADVRVAWPEGDEVLEEGFFYDAWYVDPPSGSSAGGALVRLVGEEDLFEEPATVTFGGQEATDVEVRSSSEISCRTPAGRVGPVDVVVSSSAGTQTLRDGFTYYDAADPLNGGLGGGPIEGTLDVTVLDAMSREPLPGSFVIVGSDGTSPYQGYTDGNGQITFSDSELGGRQVITASHEPIMLYDEDEEPLGEMTFESTTIVEFDARSVTIFLTPIPPPQPGEPPPGRHGGYIAGELVFEHEGEFGPYEWQIIPEPIPPYEEKVAFVYTSHSSIWSDRMDTGSTGEVFDREEYRGTNGYTFRIYSRPAAVAVFALAGIRNTETGAFHPYVMGVTRGIVVGPDEDVTGIQVYMTRQLSTNLSIVLDDPPLPNESGTPNAYMVESYIDLGAEGVIGRPETTLRSDNPDRHFWFPGWTDLTGNLSDASYTVVAGAWTVLPDFEEEQNPWSVVIRQGIVDLEEDIVIDGFHGVPRPVSPEPGGVAADGRLEWEAMGATPDFSIATLTIPTGIVPKPYWLVVLRGGETAVDLPDLATLAGMPELPRDDVMWQVWSFSVEGLDFDSWSYRYLFSRYWSAYAADSWFIRLQE